MILVFPACEACNKDQRYSDDRNLKEPKLLTGVFGREEKNVSGRMRGTATDTDRTDRALKERPLGILAVVTGCVDPFNEAYRGSVDDDVNAKAVVAVWKVMVSY